MISSDAPGGDAASGARAVETHISVLVFVGDRVYKFRKPVRLDVLDFTDQAARAEDCRREVELNRRLAPDVYLGVADVVLDGRAIDHLVVMRALPEERRLAALVQRGADVGPWLREVGRVLAAFHAGSARSPAISECASAGAIQRRWDDDVAATAPFVGTVLDPVLDREIRILARLWVRGHTTLLDQRIAAGAVCDGHGDLQAEDVFCLAEGIKVLDCIEFSDRLRHGDVCADVAFLAMDLERLGRPDLAEAFVEAYEASSGAELPRTLVHHYIAQRAYVRAKVACLRFAQRAAGADAGARALHVLAAAHLRRAGPPLVLVGGLPGTGKTTLASGLATRTGWPVLRSDALRPDGDRASGGGPGTGRYGPCAVGAVYTELLARAGDHLARGEPVIADASWIDAGQRQAARRVASAAGGELVELCCECDERTADGRIRARLASGSDASEATPAVRQFMEQRMDPWPTAVLVDTSAPDPAAALAAALRAMGV